MAGSEKLGGLVLAGRYKLEEPAGEGGMAVVYSGRDLRLNRRVAVKVLRDTLAHDPRFLTRFQREAQIVASLFHPTIVQVYDAGAEDSLHFLVMEYIHGTSLKEIIASEGRLPVNRAVSIMRQMLEAVGYAHGRGVIHRDVKPQNILVTPDGMPKLTDFGIAYLVDGSATLTAAILGSAHYLSPEQSRGGEATVQSDIYACGVVLYEMMTGWPPFDGPNALAIAHQHLYMPPPSPGARIAGIDVELERVVMRALAKDPAERFTDAAEFAVALETSKAAHSATGVRPPSSAAASSVTAAPSARSSPSARGEHISPRRPKRRRWAIAVILFALCALAGANAQRLSIPGHGPTIHVSSLCGLLPHAVTKAAPTLCMTPPPTAQSVDDHRAVVRQDLVRRYVTVLLGNIIAVELYETADDRVRGVGTIQLCIRYVQGATHCTVARDLLNASQTYDEIVQPLAEATRSSTYDHAGP